jgi:hypothetical protein
VTQLKRREILLDSGAVSALAHDRKLLDAYSRLIREDYDGSIRIPQPVLGEIFTGDPRKDVRIHRLINELCAKENVIDQLTDAIARRASELRHKALMVEDDIGPIDAFLVGYAEERSHRSSILVLTGDLKHINTLLGKTTCKNVDVEVPR